MIIKKFVEKDSRKAMSKIREEFGADAVVLSSRAVGDAFEMIAAANYDEHDLLRHCDSTTGADSGRTNSGDVVPLKRNQVDPKNIGSASVPAVNRTQPETAEKVAQPAMDAMQGPTLATLQTELAGLRELIKKELPKYAQPKRSGKATSKSAQSNRRRNLSAIKSRLARVGLSAKFVDELSRTLIDTQDLKDSWSTVAQKLTSQLPMNTESLMEKGGIAALVGPVDAGKTATIAKLSALHLMTYGRGNIGVITTAGGKSGSNARLRKFTKAMDIPFVQAQTTSELKSAIEGFADKKLVLIDTPGMDGSDLRLTMQLAEFRLTNQPIDSYLVVSAEQGGAHIARAADAYSRYNPVGLVLTKLDKSQMLGGVVEALINKEIPLSYVSDGTRIPGNLHKGGAVKIMKRVLSAVKNPGLRKSQSESAVMQSHAKLIETNQFKKVVG